MWKVDSKYGKQFIVDSYEEKPASVAVLKYPARTYQGIGLSMQKDSQSFGKDTTDIIEAEFDRHEVRWS